MGRYVPPDLEGTTSFNSASGKGHPLGARARKLKTEGILVVRFECPFPIWCTTCQPEQIIGQGVRFNAEKKKVGNYYSTPIWSFGIKHTVCGGRIEIRTDPKNAEYVVVEGGRRRDTGVDKLLDGEVRIGVSEDEKKRLEEDGGFGVLEKKVDDKKLFDSQKTRLEQLVQASDRDWSDPYARSQKLRKGFRIGRRKRQAETKTGEALKDKYGLGVDMLAEMEEDGERVKFIDFGEQASEATINKPMFTLTQPATTELRVRKTDKKPTVARLPATKSAALSSTLRSNTRNAVDPFTREGKVWQPGVKRKKPDIKEQMQTRNANTLATLVAYDSDS